MGKKIFGIYLAKLDAPNSEAHARLELPASPWELHDAMDKVQLQENEELYLEIDDYPDNLTAKAMLWLWELRDIGIIGVGLFISVLALTQTGIALPLVLTAVYAFLSIRFDGTSILDFLKYAAAFLITKQQFYDWRLES